MVNFSWSSNIEVLRIPFCEIVFNLKNVLWTSWSWSYGLMVFLVVQFFDTLRQVATVVLETVQPISKTLRNQLRIE